MNLTFGIIDLLVGLVSSGLVVYRLAQNWYGFLLNQRMILLGIMALMFSFTQRGLELTFFNAPGPRPAAFLGVTGALLVMLSLAMSLDKRLTLEPSWKEALKQQEPDNYDRYLAVLAQSSSLLKNELPSRNFDKD